MKKNLFLFILSIFFVFACNNKEKKAEPSLVTNTENNIAPTKTWEFDTLRFKKNVYIDNDSTKAGMKINLSFDYPISAPDSINLVLVQNFFSKMFSNNNDVKLPPKDVFNIVIEEYQKNAFEYAKEWQLENSNTDFSDYEQSISTVGKLISSSLMTIITQQISYLGGANGAFYIKYDNIDLRKNILIRESDFFLPEYQDKLANLIQGEIGKRNRSVNKEEHIELQVDIKKIKPNENFFLSKTGLVYTYNQNEIASYGQGPVQITIAYKDLEPLVSNQYQSLLKELIQP